MNHLVFVEYIHKTALIRVTWWKAHNKHITDRKFNSSGERSHLNTWTLESLVHELQFCYGLVSAVVFLYPPLSFAYLVFNVHAKLLLKRTTLFNFYSLLYMVKDICSQW